MFWQSSGLRITLTIMALFALASGLVISAVFWQANQTLTRRNISNVLAEVRRLSEISARGGNDALRSELRDSAARADGMLYGLADQQGQPVWLGRLRSWPEELYSDNSTAVFDYTPVAQTGVRDQPQEPSKPDAQRLAIGATLRLPDGARLLVARDVTEQRDLAGTIRNWFIAGLALMSLLAVVAGWVINRALMARIGAMTLTADQIMGGDMSQRVPLTTNNDEFDALAGNLNRMLDRIESLMQGLREVSDNIAHDLKTPLNRLRIRAEQALRDPRGDAACREGLENTIAEADELIRTFNALLRVARLEAGVLGDNLETFDVSELVDDLAEFYEPVAEEASARIDVETAGKLYLSADRQLISQALTNLVENALKYGLAKPGPDAVRRIVIGTRKLAEGAEIWVADSGEGIRPEDFDRVLKRFVRLDAARSKPGTGLGLSLVAAVIRQHGGTIELADNRPGVKVILRLPRERIADVLPENSAGEVGDATAGGELQRDQAAIET